MNWIDVHQRVPDDRRKVFIWGHSTLMLGLYMPRAPTFLGVSRFNPSAAGGRFDIEIPKRFSVETVTHWAEIHGPERKQQ